MEKFLSFFRSHKKIILGVTGGLVLVGMVLFIALGGFGSNIDSLLKAGRTEEAIAEYARQMENKPSAATAAKMLDLAIEAKQTSLVFSCLKEHIHPWLEVKGVKEEFVRGAKWFIGMQFITEDVLWLEEEVRRADPQADLNPELAKAFVSTSQAQTRVRAGNQLFPHWQLDQGARNKYLGDIKSLSTGMPLIPGSHPNLELLAGVPAEVEYLPGLELVPSYLKLWLACWQGQVTPELEEEITLLGAQGDPLAILGRLRVAAFYQGLEAANPVGLEERVISVFAGIAQDELEWIMGEMEGYLDSANKAQALTFIYVAAQPGLGEGWGSLALSLLIKTYDIKVQDVTYSKPFITGSTGPALTLPVRELVEKLHSFYSESWDFQKIYSRLPIQLSSPFKINQELEFVGYNLNISPRYPALLADDWIHGTTLLVNLVTLETHRYESVKSSWSLKGDRFVLMNTSTDSTRFQIISHDGTVLEYFTIAQGFPALEGVTPDVDWFRPNQLKIEYWPENGINELPEYVLDLGSKVVQKLTASVSKLPYSYLACLDLYLSSDEDSFTDDAAGVRQWVDSAFIMQAENSELFITQDKRLMYKNSNGTKELLPGESCEQINWAARIGDMVYFAMNSHCFALNPVTGAVERVTGPAPKYERVTISPQGHDYSSELVYNWELYDWPGTPWTIEGKTLPVHFVPNYPSFRVLKVNGRYLMLIQGSDGDSISPYIDSNGQNWILAFR